MTMLTRTISAVGAQPADEDLAPLIRSQQTDGIGEALDQVPTADLDGEHKLLRFAHV